MKKIYLAAFVLCINVWGSFAQTNTIGSDNATTRCATVEVLANLERAAGRSESVAQFEAWMSSKIAEIKANPLARGISPVATIPVVFHVIHKGEAPGTGLNVSRDALHQQLLQLNKDFANLSNSPYGIAEDMGIRFALAQRDPSGTIMAEPGIDRIYYVDKGWTAPPYNVGAQGAPDYLNNVIKVGSTWDNNRYLNIWVSDLQPGILGIATFPASSGLSGLSNAENSFTATAGVSVSYITIGSVFAPFNGACNTQYGKGKTLTHELGHFFGLRHIWGDGTCASDFCNDTPTHQGQNNGEPQHPKPNACGTPDEQFENYMDYCDDIVQSTFTVNQGDRMEAVWLNSPRRASLASSNVGSVPPTPLLTGNEIQFADCDGTTTISEASGMTSCPRFRDVKLLLNVQDRATASTLVTINTAGTAVNGVDYQLLTPTVSFANGDNGKSVDLRIFDDGAATGNRSIIVSYTIGAGGGVSIGPRGQTYTITILEDDVVSAINALEPSARLFSENFGTTPASGQLPAGWIKGSFGGSTNVFTVNAQYGAATGFEADGRLLHITNEAGPAQTAETAGNAYNSSVASNYIAVTPLINTTGYKNVRLTFDYACFGELVGNTLFDVGRLRYSTGAQNQLSVLPNNAGNAYYFYNAPGKTSATITLPASLENIPVLYIGFEWINDANGNGTNPGFTIDNIVVTGDVLGVETVLNQSSTQSINSGQTVQYTSNNKVIAQVANPTQNIGCLTATVSRAGTSLSAINTSTGSYQRSDKVIRLSPAAANTANYQATFYYTAAELAPWGPNISSLKILKVADGVDLSSTLTTANSSLYTPVVNNQLATAGYASFTVSVTGGFSQFLLVSANTLLPVTLLSFEARPVAKSIQLSWKTTAEYNNKGFVIERSTNGTDFETIGWKDGAGTSNTVRHYGYIDNFVQPNELYYYRLRQTDLDARESLSDIRQARIGEKSGLIVNISPNPARGQVRIFTSGVVGLSNINLLDPKGQLVQSWKQVNCSAAPQILDISKIAAGVYVIQVMTGDVTSTEKLIIN